MKTGSDRLLFIHAGGGKTGSSALQSALSEKKAELDVLGIMYANPPAMESDYTITSGNGTTLYDLAGTSRWESEGSSLLESYLGPHTVGICSSEFLGNMAPAAWLDVINSAQERGITLRVIFFVRSPASYLSACYNQDVKRGGVAGSLDDYLLEASWHHLDALTNLDAVLPAESLSVLNYDVVRQDIAKAFAGSFPELAGTEKLLRTSTSRTVNRSLDSIELSLVRQVNAQLGKHAGERLSNALIYAAPEKDGGIDLTVDQASLVANKYADGAGWINARFLADGQKLQTAYEQLAPARQPEDADRTFARAWEWATHQIAGKSANLADTFLEALRRIDWQNANLDGIPADFDPLAYLALNEDVFFGGSAPFQHFLSSGKDENRAYRWPVAGGVQHDAEIGKTVSSLLDQAASDRTVEPQGRLVKQYQLASMLSSFASREREYLDEIRRLSERRGYERAEIRQEISKLGPALDQSLGSALNASSQTVLDALGQLREHQDTVQGALAGRLHDSINSAQNAGLEALQHAVVELRDGHHNASKLSEERILDANSAVLGGMAELQSGFVAGVTRLEDVLRATASQNSAALADLSQMLVEERASVIREIEAVRAEQARMREVLNQQESDLAIQRETVSRYREAGLFGFIWWGIRRSLRP